MAEPMDEHPRRPLQQDLTCSVCRGIFSDPQMLPCTHSFCRQCLQKSTHFSGELCPLCREKFAAGQVIPNRALSQVCHTFVRYPHEGTVQGPGSEASCNLHLKPLLLYCEKDELPLCVDCVSLHNTHKLWPLTEAVPICKVTRSLVHRLAHSELQQPRGLSSPGKPLKAEILSSRSTSSGYLDPVVWCIFN